MAPDSFELIIDTPGPEEAEVPAIDHLTLALGVPGWDEQKHWSDSGEVYYEAEFWDVDASRDYIRTLADELGVNAAQGHGSIVEMRDEQYDIGATGLGAVDVLVLAVQSASAVAMTLAFSHVHAKLRGYTRGPTTQWTEAEAIDKARQRVAIRYGTDARDLRLLRTTDGPDAIEVKLAEPAGLPRYTVEFRRTEPSWRISRRLEI